MKATSGPYDDPRDVSQSVRKVVTQHVGHLLILPQNVTLALMSISDKHPSSGSD
jgi:hypothetical protein